MTKRRRAVNASLLHSRIKASRKGGCDGDTTICRTSREDGEFKDELDCLVDFAKSNNKGSILKEAFLPESVEVESSMVYSQAHAEHNRTGVEVYAETGVAKISEKFGIYSVEGKALNASAKAKANLTGVEAMAKAEIVSVSAGVGPLKAKIGLSADTGVGVGINGVEMKFLGTGFSVGKQLSVSAVGVELKIDLGRLWPF